MERVYSNYYSREAKFESKTVNEDERSIEGVLSTEDPVMVWDWERWEPVREILLMSGVTLPSRLPLLNAHSRFSTSDVIGSTRDIELTKDSKGNPILVAKNFFSSTEDKVFTKAKEGHITDTSIGYVIDPEKSVYLKKGESKEIKGRVYKNDDDLTLVIRKKWELFENSLVPIGADQRAKLRSELKPMEEEDNKEEREMELEEKRQREYNYKKRKLKIKALQ
jgi:hypothetical protein